MSGAIVSGAIMSGAIVNGAIVSGAIMSGAIVMYVLLKVREIIPDCTASGLKVSCKTKT